MPEDIIWTEEEISRLCGKGDKQMSSDEQLALFMHRFNLDWDTIEIMPAFSQHCKELFNKEIKK